MKENPIIRDRDQKVSMLLNTRRSGRCTGRQSPFVSAVERLEPMMEGVSIGCCERLESDEENATQPATTRMATTFSPRTGVQTPSYSPGCKRGKARHCHHQQQCDPEVSSVFIFFYHNNKKRNRTDPMMLTVTPIGPRTDRSPPCR